jgi:RNA polymerase sigma-54 factor
MTLPALRTTQRQQHAVTPRLQHAVRLLQLSSLDFAQEVHEAMGRNPFLEIEEPAPDASHGDDAGPDSAVDLNAGDSDAPIGDSPYERDSWQQSSSSVRTQGSENDIGALDLIAAEIGLRAHLHTQINVLPLSPRDHALACAIVESLDDDGYLRTPLEELGATSGMLPEVDETEMLIALKRVQSLDPCGVGARNVSECLQLQVSTIETVTNARRRVASSPITSIAWPSTTSTAWLAC